MMGAEAQVTIEDDRVVKERVVKQYRHPDLDDRLRKERTTQEKRLLEKAGAAGVPVPAVLERDWTTLVIERIDGDVFREAISNALERCRDAGRHIARLHDRGIIHGDLTTSNMILSGDTLYFIDFGLGFSSQRIEDRATDLHLLQEVFESTHTDVAAEAMERVLAGYRDAADDAEDVFERMADVEARGRYTGS